MASQSPISEFGLSLQPNPQDPWLKKHVLTFDGGGIRGYYSLLFVQRLMHYIEQEENERGPTSGIGASHLGEQKRVTSFSPCDEPRDVSHLGTCYTPFLPCHYFDYIAGTSTGGLIAIMLGRFRMTVDDCIYEYRHLAGSVFGRPRYFHAMNCLISRCKYNTKKFEQVITNVIMRRMEQGRLNPQNVPFVTDYGLCRVFVIANRVDSNRVVNEHRFFRSYEVNIRPRLLSRQMSFIENFKAKDSRGPGDVYVWQVARATTAAPMYFEPLELITGTKVTRGPIISPFNRTICNSLRTERLEDGGLGTANNPSKEMYDELMWQIPTNMAVSTFVSVGTARPIRRTTGLEFYRVIRAEIDRIGDPEPTHQHMEGLAAKKQTLSYFRFNEPDGLAGVEFDTWQPKATGQDTIAKMTASFNTLVGRAAMVKYMRKCAKELVTARRARVEASMTKWERFALGRYFCCDVEDCSDDGPREIDEAGFRFHLRERHKLQDEGVEAAIERCRHQWEYRGINP
ncbi:FabD/lysophospholipase-like protein [Hypoxylon sp. EC38]|nr:FabD/lysophospholipase-like protein [Hypoxylon sp. EC38]